MGVFCLTLLISGMAARLNTCQTAMGRTILINQRSRISIFPSLLLTLNEPNCFLPR